MLEEATLWRLIEARAEATPDAPMAVDERDRRLSFADYHASCLAVARALSARGIGPGALVSWMLPTRLEALVLVGALARLEAVQNPILPIYRRREVGFIVGQARPALLVTPGVWRGFDYAALAREVAADLPGMSTLIVEDGLPGAPALGQPSLRAPSGTADGTPLPAPPKALPAADLPIRWLFYSSGTTADPKGAFHTDASLQAAAKGMALGLDLRAEDRIAFVFPFTHIGGFAWLFAGLATGACQILIEQFAAPDTMAVLRRHGVTLGTAGTVFHETYLRAARACSDPPLFPHMRAFPGGGAPKPPQLHFDLVAEFGGAGICSGWGLTEAPNLTMVSIHDPAAKKAGSEGRPALPEIDLRVVLEDETLAAPGESGELRVRGPNVCRGHLDASLDAAAFDAHGYFRTGDLGFIDADGFVVITGRRKDVIIRKGENIPAREVEDLLYTHPKVAEVAVIGLPDARTGERCCAVVVCERADEPLAFEEMQRFLRARELMVQKIPEQLELVEALPRNATGKILKHVLRARFGPSAGPSTPSTPESPASPAAPDSRDRR